MLGDEVDLLRVEQILSVVVDDEAFGLRAGGDAVAGKGPIRMASSSQRVSNGTRLRSSANCGLKASAASRPSRSA
jgi:hypothetical protein